MRKFLIFKKHEENQRAFFPRRLHLNDCLNSVKQNTLFFLKVLEKKSHFVDKILFFTVDQIIKGSDLNKEVIVSANARKDASSTKQFTAL